MEDNIFMADEILIGDEPISISIEEEVDENVEETVEEEVQNQETTIEGRVGNCERLNIRKDPSIDSDVLAVITEDTLLEIDLEKSTDDWYYVCTPVGIEGFCMKKFVI